MAQLVGQLGGGAQALEHVGEHRLRTAPAHARVGVVAPSTPKGDEQRRCVGGGPEGAHALAVPAHDCARVVGNELDAPLAVPLAMADLKRTQLGALAGPVLPKLSSGDK